MKPSGIEWIGDIPDDWEVRKGKFLFKQRNSRGNTKKLELLSPTQKYGVIPQSKYEELTGMKPVKLDINADLASLKTICNGDYCISLRSFQGGFEYSSYEGVVSPAYQVFYPTKLISRQYYKYLFKVQSFIDKINSYAMSLRDGKNISFEDFSTTYLPFPPLKTQQKIADYLDEKCGEIDATIAKQKESIEKLKAYKQSLISETVTKGLDKSAPLKPSGIKWLGEIPQNARIIRLRFLSSIQTGDKDTVNRVENGKYPFYVRSPIVERIDTFSFDGEAILMAGDGVGAGKVFHYVNGKFDYHQRVYNIHNLKGVLGKFLYYYLRENFYKEIEQSNAKSTVDSIRLPMLLDFPIIVYPYDLQKEIVSFLDKKVAEIDAIIIKKQNIIQKLDAYKKSLIFECVTGKQKI